MIRKRGNIFSLILNLTKWLWILLKNTTGMIFVSLDINKILF